MINNMLVYFISLYIRFFFIDYDFHFFLLHFLLQKTGSKDMQKIHCF